jgi:hypothetical protein
LHAEVVPRKVTIMEPRPEDGRRHRASDEAVSSENRPRLPLLLIVIPAALSAVVFTNSWLPGTGSWPDWVYILLVVGSLALIVTTVVQRRRGATQWQ